MTRFFARPLVLLVALVSLAASTLPTTGATNTTPFPTLTNVSVAGETLGTIEVRGKEFSPGGQVYIALYDRWGATLYETRWVTSSSTVYGRDNSADPAAGYHRGGTVREVFAHLCDATPMVRAFDQETATWSNWLDVHPGC